MSMSRKDYVLLARTLNEAVKEQERKYGSSGLDAAANTARAVARALEATQPNFDRARFVTACGVFDFDGEKAAAEDRDFAKAYERMQAELSNNKA